MHPNVHNRPHWDAKGPGFPAKHPHALCNTPWGLLGVQRMDNNLTPAPPTGWGTGNPFIHHHKDIVSF